MGNFYDGTKLLSLKDRNGETPEIYICTTNRSAGKTTYFSRVLVNRFLKKGEKFCLLYRFKYELDSIGDKFFKDIKGLFFNEYEMTSASRANGIYHELFLHKGEHKQSCGYAVALNSADGLKKYSHLLSDTCIILFDEFQPETNIYCPDEITKFQSIHTSIARGQGKQVRYVPVVMLSNAVTLLNPYFVAFDISTKLQIDTKFYRGNGLVLEQGYVESAAKQQAESAFNRAFAKDEYQAYSQQNVYLRDNYAFIEKMNGRSTYLCTLKFGNASYGVRAFSELGIIYCDDRPDKTFRNRIAVTTDDMAINYVMLKNNELFLSQLRWYFNKGCFRFKNLQSKEVIMKALSY